MNNICFCIQESNKEQVEKILKENNINYEVTHNISKNKYSNDCILKIAYLLRDGKTPKEICNEVNIEYNSKTIGLINNIKYHKLYNYLTKDIDMSGSRKSEKERKEELAHNICKLLEKGYNYKQIIDELELEDTRVIRHLITNIKTGHCYKKNIISI